MGRVLTAVLIASLAVAVPALADQTITAHTPNQFSSQTTTIDQGEKVTFRNLDIVGHDVTSERKSEDGKPLFRSELVEPQSSGPVEGTQYLATGTYPFVCTVHPGMDATLKVTSAGKPVPRPAPPKLEVKIASKSLDAVLKDGKLKVRVTSTKAQVNLSATKKSAKLGSTTARFKSAGSRTVTLKLSKAGRKALRGRKSAKVTVKGVATDAAGQTAKSTASRTLS